MGTHPEAKNVGSLRVASTTRSSLWRQQIGLNGRSFWKRSFRFTVLATPKVFWQKVRYTHLNPVRAGYRDREEDYPWSSKRFWEAGLWSEDAGLDAERALEMLDRSE